MTWRPDWHRVDIISDLHLQVSEPATARAWFDYLRTAPFDALFILGDLFEVWVGDDVLHGPADDSSAHFARRCVHALHVLSQRAPVFVMQGNRDFLLGPAFASAAGCTLIDDPCVMAWDDHRWLLSHGDAWCLDDRDYLAFRAEVRQADWQAAFLARPLVERQAIARQLRERSEQRKQASLAQGDTFADVDHDVALDWLRRTQTSDLIHGHTHRPAIHRLGEGHRRVVLSDWDADSQPPRLEALSVWRSGVIERGALRPCPPLTP